VILGYVGCRGWLTHLALSGDERGLPEFQRGGDGRSCPYPMHCSKGYSHAVSNILKEHDTILYLAPLSWISDSTGHSIRCCMYMYSSRRALPNASNFKSPYTSSSHISLLLLFRGGLIILPRLVDLLSCVLDPSIFSSHGSHSFSFTSTRARRHPREQCPEHCQAPPQRRRRRWILWVIISGLIK
jgi:hypothetical protein